MSELASFLPPLLEDLASLRSSGARRLRTLTALDRLLATLCVPPTSEPEPEASERSLVLQEFVRLQDDIDTNVISRLVPLLARLLPSLHSSIVQKDPTDALEPILNELSVALQVIQGLCLMHAKSRDAVGKRSSLEVVLDLLILTRHLPASDALIPPTPSKASEASVPPAAFGDRPPLASALIDTLFCILADSTGNMRIFEECGGLDAVMKVLKTKGGRKDVRMKSLEFLFFYLMPEDAAGLEETEVATPELPPATLPQVHTPQGPSHDIDRFDESSDASSDSHRQRLSSHQPPALPSTGRKPSKHRSHGLGISSSEDDSHDLAPPVSFSSLAPPDPPSSRSSSVSSSETVVPARPSRTAPSNALGISHQVVPSQRKVTPTNRRATSSPSSSASSSSALSAPASASASSSSRQTSLSKPRHLLPTSSQASANLDSFVPETPKRPRDASSCRPPVTVARTPSRYRIEEQTPGGPHRPSSPNQLHPSATHRRPSKDIFDSQPLPRSAPINPSPGLMLPPPLPSASSRTPSSTTPFKLAVPPSPSSSPRPSPSSSRHPAPSSSPLLSSFSALPSVPSTPSSSHYHQTPRSHRAPSTSVLPLRASTSSPRTRSVQQKKEMLSRYLSNVDGLVAALEGSGPLHDAVHQATAAVVPARS